MLLRVVFLGTAGSIPTPKRNLPAIAIIRGKELLLFDCGEGTQRQMIKGRIGFHKKTKIFITHMHGDHILGLPGLFQTMALLDREKKVEIYGPFGIRAFVKAINETVQFTLTFPIKVYEIKVFGMVCEGKNYNVQAIWANHGIQSLSFALIESSRPGRFFPEKARSLGVPEGSLWSMLQRGLQVKLSNGRIVKPEEVLGPLRPGRKIVYTGDTRPSKDLITFAENADLLIHDATFDNELLERAHRDGHSTASQAAKVAKEAKTKWLILTHISSRYKDPGVLLEQAGNVFSRVDLAEDLLKIDLPLLDE